MTDYLTDRQRRKFATQRTTLLLALGMSFGACLGLLAWSVRFPDLALRQAAELTRTRALADHDARVHLARTRQVILARFAQDIAQDPGEDLSLRQERVHALTPLQAHLEEDAREPEPPLADLADLSPVTKAHDPLTGQEVVLNTTATGTLDPTALARFEARPGTLSALLAERTRRIRVETPVDLAEVVHRDVAASLAEIRASK